jgi:hypothetical protein
LDDVTLVYLVQHGEKEPLPGDPGLTRRGQEQARLVGRRLRGLGISALYSSPMRRARETAEGIASVTGLTVEFDARLRERLNWDESVPFDAFMDLWAACAGDGSGHPAMCRDCRGRPGRRHDRFAVGLTTQYQGRAGATG